LLDGSLIRKDSIPVQGAYGDLRVFGRKVCICVSSGPTNALDAAMTPDQVRLGSDIDDAAEIAEDLFADQILEWDLTSGAFRRINIPDPVWVSLFFYYSNLLDFDFELFEQHAAEYAYPSEGRVSLACLFDQQDPSDQLALQCFNVNSDDQYNNRSPRFFSAGSSSYERLLKGAGVGIEGSTKSSDVIVHSFDRIAVYSKAFLNTEIVVSNRVLSQPTFTDLFLLWCRTIHVQDVYILSVPSSPTTKSASSHFPFLAHNYRPSAITVSLSVTRSQESITSMSWISTNSV